MADQMDNSPSEPDRLDWLSASERSHSWGIRFRLTERLRNSVLVVPCIYIGAVAVLAILTNQLEGTGDTLKPLIGVSR